MAKLDKSKYDSTAVESVAPINVNTHPDEPWLNPVWRVVNGATIADKILADGEHEVITALKLGELASTKMVPDNRMQERFDRFLAKCSDKERVIANFDLGKALGTDAETVYCRYFPQIGEAANDNEPAVKLTPPPLPKMHPEPNTPQAAGGLLCEMSEWITSTAIIPVPELSLAASNTLLCGMFGDRALTPLGGGINMYMVTVMRAAAGKGHAPKMITRLANAVGKPGAVSNGDPTSYAAIERMLRNNISTAMIMDEYGETLQEVNSHQKNSAAASIRKAFLALYDQADSVFDGRKYASSDTKKDDSPLLGPALTIFGMTTGSKLYPRLGEESLSGGYMSRFVFVEGAHPDEIKVPSISRVKAIPQDLLDRLRKAVLEFPKPQGEGNLVKKYTIPFEEGEDGEAYKRYGEIFLWQQWKGWDDIQHNINGRAAENSLRLAVVRAISREPNRPVVNVEDIEWGWALVHRSIEIITAGVDRFMSGSVTEALRKAIKEALRQAEGKTLAWSHLLKRQGVKQAERKDVINAL